MSDPYVILGVDRVATDDQVREAYKRLAIKYSGNDYAQSPLGDLAAKEMADIDAAFDQIMSQRRIGATTADFRAQSGSRYHTQTTYSAPNSSGYAAVRDALRRKEISLAEQRLLAVDDASRGAEWLFLMGSVCHAKGWLNEANHYYASAASMEPGNSEYRAARDSMEQERTTGYGSYRPQDTSTRDLGCGNGDGLSDCCSFLCCMSLCNNCCCGR